MCVHAKKLKLENVGLYDIDEHLVDFYIPKYSDQGVVPDAVPELDYYPGIGERTIKDDIVSTGLDALWLGQAIFPVLLDTDVNLQVSASNDDCEWQNGSSIDNGSLARFGFIEDGYVTARTYNYAGNAHGAKLDISYTAGVGSTFTPKAMFYTILLAVVSWFSQLLN